MTCSAQGSQRTRQVLESGATSGSSSRKCRRLDEIVLTIALARVYDPLETALHSREFVFSVCQLCLFV
jgi:hypothetical protein